MKQRIQKFFILAFAFSLFFQGSIISAHSGRTDSHGGHHDYKDASNLGSYHYHHGYGPHLHKNGVCPYTSSSSSSSSSYSRKCDKTVQKYQRRLNQLGYSCGKADEHCGSQTKRAIRKFQKRCKLSVTGNLNAKTKNKINQLYRSKYE